MDERTIARKSAVIYTGMSLVLSVVFILITLRGNFTLVEVFGGSVWIFILSMIILMPIIIPYVKKKSQK